MPGSLFNRTAPKAAARAGLHYLPGMEAYAHATLDIYSGNGSYPVPGPKRQGSVSCLVSGSWMAGHRQAVAASDKSSHIVLVDPGIEIRDPYTGNGQPTGQNADALILYGLNLSPTAPASPWYFVVFSFLTFLPGIGRKKVVVCDQQSSWPATILLKDRFLDANGTSIIAHFMDQGAGWNVPAGDPVASISGNELSFSGGTLQRIYSNAGAANFSLAAVDILQAGPAGNFQGLVLRYADSNNYLAVLVDTTIFKITKTLAGTTTTLTSTPVSLTAGTKHTITATANGSTITAQLDGGNTLTTTTSVNQTQTNHGILATGTPSATGNFGNFYLNQ